MTLYLKYELIAPFAGAVEVEAPSEQMNVSLTDDEVNGLKRLFSALKLNETFLGEVGWFLGKAKTLVENEAKEQQHLYEIRKSIYRPIIDFEALGEHGEQIYKDFLEREKSLARKQKDQRDRNLYKEYKALLQELKQPFEVAIKRKGKTLINIQSPFFLERIKNALDIKRLASLEIIIKKIGEDSQNQTISKTESYRNRVELADNLYMFITWYLSFEETKINLLGGGILYLAGFSFPFQENYTNAPPYNFENISIRSNKRYSDYFRDLAQSGNKTKFEKAFKKHKKSKSTLGKSLS